MTQKNGSRKKQAERAFNGSLALFDYCWRKLLAFERAGCAVDDVDAFLDSTAAEAVNNERSKFWIRG